MSIEQSRERARGVIRRLKDGLEPFEPPPVKPDTVADVMQTFLKRHVEARGLLTGDETRRVLEKHILPVWRDRPFAEIRRSDIARLLDAIEDQHSAWVADSVLAALRRVSSWYAARHDTYVPPFTRNMRRVPEPERKRSRVLNDDELRAVWRAAEAAGTYGAFIRLALCTGQRRTALTRLRWDDISPDGVWTIRQESVREKGTAGSLQLPKLALDIINAQPRFAGNPHVFAGTRPRQPIAGFSERHAAFMAKAGVNNGFTIHDLRRCARSLLSKAGIRPDICERVLGHARPAIEATYDQHHFRDEKAHALAALARLIEQIVHPPTDAKVVPLRAPAVQS
jgi:integrase